MTPASVITAARRKYNAVSDSFFDENELYDYLYQGELELVLDSYCIEATTQTTTVTGTSQYTVPTNTFSIKRVTYNGAKLKPIDFRDDDLLTLNDSDTTDTGTPLYYVYYNDQIELRPTPDAAGSLDWRVYKEPEQHTASSTFSTPNRYHMGLSDFIVAEMFSKDQNRNMAQYYRTLWEQHKFKAKQLEKKRKRGDSFASVKAEESMSEATLGVI